MAIELMLQVEAVKGRFGGDGAAGAALPAGASLHALRAIALCNHIAARRSQPWSAFEQVPSLVLDAVTAEVARGRLAVLEVTGSEVDFAHLSYQEYLAGDA
eukprot:102963-Prymnesium_polylepis.1